MSSSISTATLCHVCGTNFVNRSELIEHLRLKHGQSFEEENTNEIANQNELEEENDEKSDKTKDLCVCTKSECKKVHKKKKQFHCQECDKYFILKGSLTAHNNEVHEKKPFDCKKCDRSYTSERALKAHDERVHANSQKCHKCNLSFYECDLCYSEFKTKVELEKHQSKVDKGRKIYQCSICSACFMSKYGLKNHINTHKDRSKYECNNEIANLSHVCNTNHVNNSAVKRKLPDEQSFDEENRNEIANQQEQKRFKIMDPFICPFCQYNCDSQVDLNMHIRSNHKDQEPKTKAEQETETDDGMSESNEINTEKSDSDSESKQKVEMETEWEPSPHRILEYSSDPFLTEVANISPSSSPLKFTEN